MVQFRYDSSQLRIWNWLDQNVGRLHDNLLYQIDRIYALSLILLIFRRCTVGLWLKKFPEIGFFLIREKGKWWSLIHSFTGLSMITLIRKNKSLFSCHLCLGYPERKFPSQYCICLYTSACHAVIYYIRWVFFFINRLFIF